MKRSLLLLTVIICSAVAFAQQAPPALPGGMTSHLLPPAATPQEVREDELYNKGTTALNEGRWQTALDAFTQVAKLGGRRADGALYWKAYAENKMGNRAAAAATIADLRKAHPRSTWLKDAGALELEMRQASGKPPRPESESDEELKLLAINSLMNTNEERAIPLLEKLLNSNQSLKIKERALFVLAQSDSPRAHQVLANVARGQSHPGLQLKAIHNLGIEGTDANLALLAEIYGSTNDVNVKREVLQSLGIAGDTKHLLALARSEKDPELKKAVIQGLAVAGAEQELRQLYRESSADPETRSRVIQASIITGDSDFINDVVKTETDPKLRKEAIRVLGINGDKNSSATLLSMYATEKEKSVKQSVVEALFVSGDAKTLVDLARKETDPEMRQHIVEKLSVMGDPEATEYLMEILNK